MYHHSAFDGNARWTLPVTVMNEIHEEFYSTDGRFSEDLFFSNNKYLLYLFPYSYASLLQLKYKHFKEIFTPLDFTWVYVAECIVHCFRVSYTSIPSSLIRVPAIVITGASSLHWLQSDSGIDYAEVAREGYITRKRRDLLLELYYSGVTQGLIRRDSSITKKNWSPEIEEACVQAIIQVGAISIVFGPKKYHYVLWHIRFKADSTVQVKQVDGYEPENGPRYSEELNFFLDLLKIDPEKRVIVERYKKEYDPIQYNAGDCFFMAFSAMLQYLQTPIYGSVCPFNDSNMDTIRYYSVYLLLVCKKCDFNLRGKKPVLPPQLVGAWTKYHINFTKADA